MKDKVKWPWNTTSLIAWLSLFVAVIGGVPGFLSIKNELFKTSVGINFDEENSFLGILASDKKERFGKKAILFYEIRFVGAGEMPTTVHNIQFYVYIEGKWVEGKRIVLQTNFAPNSKARCLITGNYKDNLFIVGWNNFNGEYYTEVGKIQPFNVAFMFDVPEEDILSSKKWKFITTDYLGKQYSTIVNSPKIETLSKNNFFIFDCYVHDSHDIQEFLNKYKRFNYAMLMDFLQSKHPPDTSILERN